MAERVGSHRLLLVEDDDGDALLVEELLADSGEVFSIERAHTVEEAVERAVGGRRFDTGGAGRPP